MLLPPPAASVVINPPVALPEPMVRVGIKHLISFDDATEYLPSGEDVVNFVQAAIFYGRGDHLIVATSGYKTDRYTGLPLETIVDGSDYKASALLPARFRSDSLAFHVLDNVWLNGFDIENRESGGRSAYYGLADLTGVVNYNIPGLVLRVVSRSSGTGSDREYAIALTIQSDFPDSETKTAQAGIARAEWMLRRLNANAPVWLGDAIRDALSACQGQLETAEPVAAKRGGRKSKVNPATETAA